MNTPSIVKLPPIVFLFICLLASCKPKDNASIKAIVGDDNGKEKAMAIVGMRNSVDIKAKVDTSTNEGKQLLESIYETYFGLVECETSNIRGTRIAADSWMNLIEFYSFSGLLYLDKDRRIVVFNEKDGKETPEYFPCGIISAQLLTAPMLLAAPAEMDSFPMAESVPKSIELGLKEKFLLVQSIYLALRGPHSEGSVSPKSFTAATVSMASQSYPDVAVTDNALAKSMTSADPYYNPCSTITVTDRKYLQNWRSENYDCVSSSTDKNIKNFRPSAKTGYGKIRTRVQNGLSNLSSSLSADAGNTSLEQARRVLRSTQAWKNIKGADAPIAQSFAQGQSTSVAGAKSENFSLSGSDQLFTLPATGAYSDQPEFGIAESAAESMNLAGSDAGVASESIQPFLRNLMRLFEGSQLSPYQPNFMANPEGFATVLPADQARANELVKQFRKSEGDMMWDYGGKIASARSDKQKDEIFSEYQARSSNMELDWLNKAGAVVLNPKSYSEQSGITSVNSTDGNYTFRRGESLGATPGVARVYQNTGKTKVGDVSYHMYKDLTAPKEYGGFGVGRELFRDASNPNVGGQVITSSLGTFTSGWQASTPGGATGLFTQSDPQRRQSQLLIDKAISSVQSTVASGTQQGSNWGNLKASFGGLSNALSTQSQLSAVGGNITQGGEDIFGGSSRNQAALRSQASTAAGQIWTSGKGVANDGYSYVKENAGGYLKAAKSYFSPTTNSRPSNSSSTPIVTNFKPSLTISGPSGNVTTPQNSSQNIQTPSIKPSNSSPAPSPSPRRRPFD